MSAGAPVVASDLGAFRRVLDDGRLGHLFPVADTAALGGALVTLFENPQERAALARAATAAVRRYDWTRVAEQVLAVYETVRDGADRVGEDPRARSWMRRWRD